MFRNGLTVVKFGSSVLRGEEDLPAVVEEIGRWCGREQYVLAVVSALGNTTGELFKRARRCGEPTALFLAHELRASRCRLVKDVDGLYSSDPKCVVGARPKRYMRLGWQEALDLRGKVVQAKALEFARENRLRFEVAAVGRAEGTVVGEEVA
jgi:homoserine dehydrogenase